MRVLVAFLFLLVACSHYEVLEYEEIAIETKDASIIGAWNITEINHELLHEEKVILNLPDGSVEVTTKIMADCTEAAGKQCFEWHGSRYGYDKITLITGIGPNDYFGKLGDGYIVREGVLLKAVPRKSPEESDVVVPELPN